MTGTATNHLRPRRSLLFAPGNRTEVHAKALSAGADIVCLDLEDAVPPAAKNDARRLAMGFLSGEAGPERVIRINALRTADGLRDLLAIIEARPSGGVVFLPKVASADEIRLTEALLDEAALPLSLAVLIESVEGLEHCAAILRASPRIAFAMLGGVDLAAELGVEVAHAPLLYARQRLVHAARLAGVDLLDVPCLALRDPEAVRAEAITARDLGFTGKAAIHPAQLVPINTAFSPTPAQIAHAERVVTAWQDSPNGLAVLDGKLVERPVVRTMQRILGLRDSLSAPN
jgi:citrate lyase beta subunit